ncbi:MAG: peptidylprolyl isomerase [Kofleriaceae bacterium]
MKRIAPVIWLSVVAFGLAACEKSSRGSEEAPVQRGSKPKALPPPAPPAPPPPTEAGHGADPHDHGAGTPAAAPGASAPMPPPAAPPVAGAGGDDGAVRAPVAADLATYLKAVPGKGTLRATIATSMGTFHCALYEREAPMTVANFVGLATGQKPWKDPLSGAVKTGTPLYDGLIFHRVIPGFMIQGGDPLGKGVGGPGYNFDDEVASGLKMEAGGLLAMANAGPGTNGSQFFITEAAAPWLTGHHTIFGKCDEVDLVKQITGVPKGPGDRPTTPVSINQITISRR